MAMRWQAAVKASPATSFAPATSGVLQRACGCGGHSPGGECANCRQKRMRTLQRVASRTAAVAEVPPIVHDVLRSSGQPLDEATRAFMEPRFGHNFSHIRARTAGTPMSAAGLDVGPPDDDFEHEANRVAERILRSTEPETDTRVDHSERGVDFGAVRVHADTQAAAAARAVNAHAFAVGGHVVFGEGQYAPATSAGRRLLAHELTHTVQQGNGQAVTRSDAQVAQVAQVAQLQPASGPTAPATGGLSDEMLQQIARRVHEAMAGLGTDEEAIYSALAGRTQDQVDAISRVYRAEYGSDLQVDLQGELNESELMQLAAFSPTAASPATPGGPSLAELVADQLDKAMAGLGTDEAAIFAALTGRTEAERLSIKNAYKDRTNRELEADLRDELSGADLTTALMLLNQGLLAPEDELYLAMKGLGTDEATIFRVLGSLTGNAVALQDLERNYKVKYGDLINDLRDDLSAEEYRRARQVLVPTLQDAYVLDCDPAENPLHTPESVRAAHARAVQILSTAITRSANTADPAVQAAALRYFKITLPAATPDDIRHWNHVRRALTTIARAEIEATYECEPAQSRFHGWCGSGTLAVSIDNIHLCPDWWTTYTSVDYRAGVLVHEWGHRFGEGVALMIETYCFETSNYQSAPAGDLVTWPDAYMQFVYDLAIGSPAPCF